MDLRILCIDCAAEDNKTNRGITSHGGGCYSMPMPVQTKCTNCGTEASGYKFCLGCALEFGHCQKSGERCRGARSVHKRLAPQIAELRATLEVARQAARATYDLAIEPFRQDATTYEEALAAADRQVNEDMRPFDGKEEEARLAYNNTLGQRARVGVDEASRALGEARKAREAAFDQAFEKWSAANDASRAAFSLRQQYDKAGSERDRSLRRANTIFSANVERLYGLLQVEQRFESAMRIMEIWDKPLLSETPTEPAQS